MLTNMQKNILKISLILLCGFLQAADQEGVSFNVEEVTSLGQLPASSFSSNGLKPEQLYLFAEFERGREKQRDFNYVEALQHFDNVLAVSSLPAKNRALVLTRIGDIYRKGGNGIERNCVKALDYYAQALAIPEYKDAYSPDLLVKERVLLYMKMAHIYQFSRADVASDTDVVSDYAKALDYYYSALQATLLLSCKLTFERYAVLFQRIGDILAEGGKGVVCDYAKALHNYEKICEMRDLSPQWYEVVRKRIEAVNQKINRARTISSLSQHLPENRKRSKPLEFITCTGNKSARVPERPTPSAPSNNSVVYARPFVHKNSQQLPLLRSQNSVQLTAVKNGPLIAPVATSAVQAPSCSEAAASYDAGDSMIKADSIMRVKAILNESDANRTDDAKSSDDEGKKLIIIKTLDDEGELLIIFPIALSEADSETEEELDPNYSE